jgi:DNA-directed RNA polymerase specialized sigma24 family protein
MNEYELQEELHKRDPAALDLLLARYSDAVHYLARLILGQVGRAEDVEEIAGDVFAAAWTTGGRI